MKTQYSAAQKAAIMTLLERNGGNVTLTAQQTGIPYRTIYDWQREMLPLLQQYAPHSIPNAVDTPKFENDLDVLAFIRQNILGELSRLSASLQYDSGFSTPYQRALVLSQLMDKLLKLDLHLKPYTRVVDDSWKLELMEEGDDEDDEDEYDDDENDKVWIFPGEDRLDELERLRAANPDHDYDDWDVSRTDNPPV